MAKNLNLNLTINGVDKSKGALGSFGSGLGNIASIAGGILTANIIGGLTSQITGLANNALNGAKDMEQLEIAFTTMLGSADKAGALLKDITEAARETPFELPELQDASKSLLAFGIEGKNVVPTLMRLGDVSAGVGANVKEVAEIYGKARVQGRLFAEDINQLTGRGIPIIGKLAEQFGVAESEVKKLVEGGEVGFPQLEQAFKAMTAEGGQFAGLMAAQSESLEGIQSNIADTIGVLSTEILQESGLFGIIKSGAETFLELLDSNKNNIKIFFTNLVEGLTQAKDLLFPFVSLMADLVAGIALFVADGDSLNENLLNVADSLGISKEAFGDFARILERGREFFLNIANILRESFGRAFERIGDIMEAIRPSVEDLIKVFSETMLPIILEVAAGFEEYLQPILNAITDTLGVVLPPIIEIFIGLLGGVMKGIKFLWDIAKPVFDLLGSVIRTAFIIAEVAWNTVLKPVFNAIVKTIKVYVLPIFKLIQKVAEPIFAAISRFIQDMVDNALIAAKKVERAANEVLGRQAEVDTLDRQIREIETRKQTRGGSNVAGPGFATGGIVQPVYAANGFVPRGTDTVAAMLTPGEGVMSLKAMEKFLRGESGNTYYNITVKADGILSEGNLRDTIVKSIQNQAKMRAKSPSEYINTATI